MEYKEFKKYTKHPETYDAWEVDALEIMSNSELDDYQREIEIDSGNLSDWDHIRAVITFRKRIKDLESQLLEVVCAIYEHANEGTYLMELAEKIDELD